MAKDAQASREALFLQPSEEGITTDPPTGRTRPLSIDVIERQEGFLALTAALARHTARSVTLRGCAPAKRAYCR
jgi:hypothetical protein